MKGMLPLTRGEMEGEPTEERPYGERSPAVFHMKTRRAPIRRQLASSVKSTFHFPADLNYLAFWCAQL